MQQYITLLRGINVGGHRKIKMADLRQLLSKNGIQSPKTYIQSGNIVFESDSSSTSELSEHIRRCIQTEYGFEVSVITFSATDFLKIAQSNPFIKSDNSININELQVAMTPDDIPENSPTLLEKYCTTEEAVIVGEGCLYLRYPNGYGRSKLTNNVIEKQLQIAATTRNWRTTQKLLEMLAV